MNGKAVYAGDPRIKERHVLAVCRLSVDEKWGAWYRLRPSGGYWPNELELSTVCGRPPKHARCLVPAVGWREVTEHVAGFELLLKTFLRDAEPLAAVIFGCPNSTLRPSPERKPFDDYGASPCRSFQKLDQQGPR